MKISEMLKREDFYAINQETLASYFGGGSRKEKLYVYPHLNVIITKHPAKSVKKYVYTEYHVKGSAVRHLLVYLYTRLAMNSAGLAAARTVEVSCEKFKSSQMIYPCNKRYRIFDFNAGTVDVIEKHGFSYEPVSRELNFRKEHCLPFILPVTKELDSGYREGIIDGIPLARLDHTEYEQKRDEVWKLWSEYVGRTLRTEKLGSYADTLMAQIQDDAQILRQKKPGTNIELLLKIAECYRSKLEAYTKEPVSVGFSHGDFHPGNIWVGNGTGRIYIIDWESYGERSIWYDRAAMFGGLRNPHGVVLIAEASKQRFCQLLGAEVPDWSRHVVTLEDILFHMDELLDFPKSVGLAEFNAFITALYGTVGAS